jgi:glycosyltransferase involved in cell wall biosynthesis
MTPRSESGDAASTDYDAAMARILHVIESLDASRGGPPVVCIRLAAAQAAHGHCVGILCRVPGGSSSFPQECMKGIPHGDAVKGFAVTAGTGALSRALAPSVGEFVRARRAEWDMLHIHAVWDPATRAAGLAALDAGLPYVIMPHGMLDEWGMRQGIVRPIKKRLALALTIGKVLRGAAFLHALTTGEREGITKYGYGQRVAVVPNGVFLEEFSVEDRVGDGPCPWDGLGNDPWALSLGRLHYMKGIDFLIAGFRLVVDAVPSARLVVAGPDYGHAPALRAMVGRLGLSDRVLFVGPVFGSARFALMRRSAVFCQMSRYEGFSVALLEALACGCPVVASHECRFPEIADVGAGRIVASEPRPIAEAISAYLADPGLRASASAAGRALVETGYTWAQVARRMDDAYRSFGLL